MRRLGEQSLRDSRPEQRHWRDKLHSTRRAEASEFLAERHKDKLSMEGVTPADRRQVIELSERCNAKMRQLYPAVKGTHSNWFRLFKRIDGDGSGKITVAEFTKLLRKVLQLNLSNLSNEELKAAWCALDTDQSGYITAGEFGQWMGLGAKAVTANGPTTLQQQRSTAAFYNRHEEALSAAEQLRRSQAAEMRMKTEMKQLREDLKDLSASRPQARSGSQRPSTAPMGRSQSTPGFAGRMVAGRAASAQRSRTVYGGALPGLHL